MTRPNALVITAALLFATASGYTDVDRTSFSTKNPFAVSLMIDKKFSLISQNESHYTIKIITPEVFHYLKTCELSIDPASESIAGKMGAAVVGQRIILWGKRSEELVDNGQFRRVNYTVLSIDPIRCTHHSLPDLADQIPSSYPDILPEVMAHQDSFDIFFVSGQTCSPCSFDVNGGKLAAPEQLKREGTPKARFFLQEIGLTNTYVYLYNFDNGTAVARILDRQFKDAYSTRLSINTTVHELATSFSYTGYEKTYIGVIYTLPETPRRTNLLVFNETLSNLTISATLPLLDNHNLVDATLVIDKKGQAYVTMLQQSDTSRTLTFVMYNEKGRIADTADIVDLPLHEDRELQSYYNPLRHCVAAHQLSPQHVTDIHCAYISSG